MYPRPALQKDAYVMIGEGLDLEDNRNFLPQVHRPVTVLPAGDKQSILQRALSVVFAEVENFADHEVTVCPHLIEAIQHDEHSARIES